MSTTPNARVRATLLLLLVGGFGFVAGILADRLLLSRPAQATEAGGVGAREGVRILLREPGSTAPAEGRRYVVLPERMTEQLALTAEQQVAVERILAEDQAALRELTEGMHAAFATVIERSRQRIEEVLTEEQRERWRAMPPRRLRIGGPEPGQN